MAPKAAGSIRRRAPPWGLNRVGCERAAAQPAAATSPTVMTGTGQSASAKNAMVLLQSFLWATCS
jgi:hypothetical protein